MRFKQPILKGERIYLRAFKESDANENAKIWNDKEIARWIADAQYPASAIFHKKFIESIKKKDDTYYYAVIQKYANKIIGAVWFNHICLSTNYQIAELCYVIGKNYRGKGYATEASRLMINWGFRNLNLLKIFAKINEFDKGSIKVIKKLGFKYEGKLRKQVFMRFPKKWCNELNYGLLKEEWIK